MKNFIALKMLHADGTQSVAHLSLSEDADENSVIDFAHPDHETQRFQGHDYFWALKDLRNVLDQIRIKALCNGARVDAVCSGMASQMGQGLKVYVVRIGQPAKMADLVETFDEPPAELVGTVQEQSDFQTQWMESLKSTH